LPMTSFWKEERPFLPKTMHFVMLKFLSPTWPKILQ
jgi:hypothetical protein